MTFDVKMDDRSLSVELGNTNLKEVLQYCKPKEQLVLLRKFGLNENKETSLQKIGKDYGLTRERVRQIENQGLMRFRRLIIGEEKYLNVLKEARKIVDMNGGFLGEEALVSKIINKGLFNFKKAELKLILISDFDLYYLKRNRFINNSFYIEPLYEDLLTELSKYTLDYFNKKGEAEDLYEYIEKLKSKFSKSYEDVNNLTNNIFYINFFSSIRGVSVFDGKVGLNEFTEVNPKTIKQKIVYVLRRVNKPLHYQEIATKVMEWFEGTTIKVNTVHNELVKTQDMFVNMGLGIYGLKEWGFKGGTVKDIVERILTKTDRPMSIKEITKEVLKEKMISPNTIILTLQKYNDIFERAGKGVYRIKK